MFGSIYFCQAAGLHIYQGAEEGGRKLIYLTIMNGFRLFEWSKLDVDGTEGRILKRAMVAD